MAVARGRKLVKTIAVPTPFPVGPANVHVILRDPVTLVDVGPLTDAAWEALEAGLLAEGLSVRDVKRVLLTHGHHDHYGQAGRIADASGARLYGGRLDRKHFEMHRRRKWLLDQMARADFGVGLRFVVVASVTWIDKFAAPLAAWDELDGGEVLAGDGYSVLVRATPGHTPGSLSFEIPEEGILFTGDTVLKGITPNAVVEENPEEPDALFRSASVYFETLDVLERPGGPANLLTGHGDPIGNYAAHHATVVRKRRARMAAIERVLAGGPKTVRELVVAVFPKARTLNVYLAYSEIVGFLMYLEDLGRVEKRRGALRDWYRLVAERA